MMCVYTSRNVDITPISNRHISVLLETTVTWSSRLVVLYVLHMMMLVRPWPDTSSGSRSPTFSISANCTFLRLLPTPFWHAAQNWWLIATAWDLVYSYMEPDFWISPQLVVMWLWSSWNVDITRIHWVLSLCCLWLETCDCDCR